MARAKIIDGKAIAARLRREVAHEVSRLSTERGIVPGLAVVLVGDDPASHVYVRNKVRQTTDAGMRSFEHRLPATATEREVLKLVEDLNHSREIHGILVQLPLPSHIDSAQVVAAIDSRKDVDGLHPLNAGLLATNRPGLVPCTPAGALILVKSVLADLAGVEAVVVGRSTLVGKPMAQLLLRENATVTVAHSKTRGLPDVIRRADVVVAAVGKPEMIRGDWIKPGAIVIDVGIIRVEGAGGKHRLVGDVAFAEAIEVAGAITPVPGGAGPMTVACLLQNTLQAARSQVGVD